MCATQHPKCLSIADTVHLCFRALIFTHVTVWFLQHQPDTALFWADKACSLSNGKMDERKHSSSSSCIIVLSFSLSTTTWCLVALSFIPFSCLQSYGDSRPSARSVQFMRPHFRPLPPSLLTHSFCRPPPLLPPPLLPSSFLLPSQGTVWTCTS